MIVLIHKLHPTGIGESLSGKKAFFINSTLIDNWYKVETHPEFQRLNTQEQNEVRAKYPRSTLIHQSIESIRFT